MLTQTDVERERYEARRKAQLDYNTGLKIARMEGHQEGRQEGLQEGWEKGERIGIIHFCERLLKRPEAATAQLAALSMEDLARLADELQAAIEKSR